MTDDIGAWLCAVQVKTRRGKGSDRGLHMSKKHEELTSPSLFHCFVDFAMGTGEVPFTYVVPASFVARCLAENHKAWLAQRGAKGQAHNDNDMRRFKPDYSNLGMTKYLDGWLEPYREAWHVMQAAAD